MKTKYNNPQFSLNMKSISSITVLSVAIALFIAVGCSAPDKETQLKELQAKQAEITKQITALKMELVSTGKDSLTVRSKEVLVMTVTPKPFNHYVQTQGAVEAEDNILVSSQGAGVITKVFVREGDHVTKGQTLAQIDNNLVLRNIEGMKSQLELVTSVYNRQKNLWDQNIGTEVQFLQAKTNKENLEKQIAVLQEQNDMMRVKSPINGIVDEVNVKAGQNIVPGMPAVRVINDSDLKITANVSEAYVTKVKKGDRVMVTIPDLKKEIEAKVTFVGRNIDQLSRTFLLEADLQSSPKLRPNMTAIVKIIYESYPTAITLPVNMIQDIKGEKVVFIAKQDGNNMIAKRVVVTMNGVFDGIAQINGLEAGTKVISAGYQGLVDGQFISVSK